MQRRSDFTGIQINPAILNHIQSVFSEVLNSFLQIDKTILSIELDPSYAEAYGGRGYAHLNAGRLSEALVDLNRALEIDPLNVYAFINRGGVFRLQGQLDRADEDLTRATDLSPENSSVYHNRGLLARDKGMSDEAIRMFSRAIELEPSNKWAHSERGLQYFLRGEYDRAVMDFDEAYFYLGEALREKGAKADAISAYEDVLRVAPGNDPYRGQAEERLQELSK